MYMPHVVRNSGSERDRPFGLRSHGQHVSEMLGVQQGCELAVVQGGRKLNEQLDARLSYR